MKMQFRSVEDPTKKNREKNTGFSSVIYAQKFTGYHVQNESIMKYLH